MLQTVVPRSKPVIQSGDKLRRSQGAFSAMLEQLRSQVEESIKRDAYEKIHLTISITPQHGIELYDLLSGPSVRVA